LDYLLSANKSKDKRFGPQYFINWASDFEADGKVVNPFHGGNFRPSSRWNWPRTVYQEHTIHPSHPNCTRVAPEKTTNPLGLAARYHAFVCKVMSVLDKNSYHKIA
jgi:hypothetical protein